MGNALACSAALASIELFETQNYMEKIKRIEAVTRREMKASQTPGSAKSGSWAAASASKSTIRPY